MLAIAIDRGSTRRFRPHVVALRLDKQSVEFGATTLQIRRVCC